MPKKKVIIIGPAFPFRGGIANFNNALAQEYYKRDDDVTLYSFTLQYPCYLACGGDRDKSKRPLMAKVACDLSTQVILTSDNPRSERPDAIIDDMLAGLDPVQNKKVLVISDRKEAIKTACKLANDTDIILVAGKGHEKYQEINGVKSEFDDFDIVKGILNQKN